MDDQYSDDPAVKIKRDIVRTARLIIHETADSGNRSIVEIRRRALHHMRLACSPPDTNMDFVEMPALLRELHAAAVQEAEAAGIPHGELPH